MNKVYAVIGKIDTFAQLQPPSPRICSEERRQYYRFVKRV